MRLRVREQHVRQRLGQVVAERLEDQVVRPGVLAEHRGARHTGDREGVEVAAAVVHQVGARQARPVAADRPVRLPAEHGPERMPDDGVLPDRLGRRGRHRRRHQAPHAGPEQGQAHAHDEVAEHVRAHRDHRQGAEAELAAQQAQSRHGPAHEHERHAQTTQDGREVRCPEQGGDGRGEDPDQHQAGQADGDAGGGGGPDLLLGQVRLLDQRRSQPHAGEVLDEQDDQVGDGHEPEGGRRQQPRDGRGVGEVGDHERHRGQVEPAQAGRGLRREVRLLATRPGRVGTPVAWPLHLVQPLTL